MWCVDLWNGSSDVGFFFFLLVCNLVFLGNSELLLFCNSVELDPFCFLNFLDISIVSPWVFLYGSYCWFDTDWWLSFCSNVLVEDGLSAVLFRPLFGFWHSGPRVMLVAVWFLSGVSLFHFSVVFFFEGCSNFCHLSLYVNAKDLLLYLLIEIRTLFCIFS